MGQAMLILLLSLTGSPQPSPAPSASPALEAPAPPTAAAPAASAGALGDAVRGAWIGKWSQAGAPAPVATEAVFWRGSTARTLVAYFTFVEGGVRRTVRRQGTAGDDGLRFVWPGGRGLVLHLDASGHLVGEVPALAAGGASAPLPAGSLALSRLRQ